MAVISAFMMGGLVVSTAESLTGPEADVHQDSAE